MSVLIGIGGVSRAGKSTLANLLAEAYRAQHKTVSVIHQDEHVVDEQELTLIRDKRDWEHPNSIDWHRLSTIIDDHLTQFDIVIMEGLFAFNDPIIRSKMGHKIMVEISKPKFLDRKKVDLRWGGTAEPDWYMQHIWNSYLIYGRPKLDQSYICLNGTRRFDIAFIIETLQNK